MYCVKCNKKELDIERKILGTSRDKLGGSAFTRIAYNILHNTYDKKEGGMKWNTERYEY